MRPSSPRLRRRTGAPLLAAVLACGACDRLLGLGDYTLACDAGGGGCGGNGTGGAAGEGGPNGGSTNADAAP